MEGDKINLDKAELTTLNQNIKHLQIQFPQAYGLLVKMLNLVSIKFTLHLAMI